MHGRGVKRERGRWWVQSREELFPDEPTTLVTRMMSFTINEG